MIPEASLDSFLQYAQSLKLGDRTNELRRFISGATDHSAMPPEEIIGAFKELRALFSQETLALAPELLDRIDVLEIDSLCAATVDDVAKARLAKEQKAAPAPAPEANPADGAPLEILVPFYVT